MQLPDIHIWVQFYWASCVAKVIRLALQFPFRRTAITSKPIYVPGMWRRLFGIVFPCVSNGCSVSIFEVWDVQAERSEALTQRYIITPQNCVIDFWY
jgi:hypothetical protein